MLAIIDVKESWSDFLMVWNDEHFMEVVADVTYIYHFRSFPSKNVEPYDVCSLSYEQFHFASELFMNNTF